jgi:hypothetical protein
LDAEWERHLLALRWRVKRRAKPEQYAIYHLHVIEDRSAAEVRQTLGVSTGKSIWPNIAGVLVKKELRGHCVNWELERLKESWPFDAVLNIPGCAYRHFAGVSRCCHVNATAFANAAIVER